MYPFIHISIFGVSGKIFVYDLIVGFGIIVCIIKLNNDKNISKYGDIAFYYIIFSMFASFFMSKYINEYLFSGATGYSFFSGLYISIVLNVLFSYICRYNIFKYLNSLSVYIPLIHFWGRLGCFFAGCCFGSPTSLPFGIIYNSNSYAFSILKNTATHPVQLYEALFNIILYFVLEKKIAFKNRFYVYIYSYSIFRFFVEFIRFDRERGAYIFNCLSPSQFVSIFSIVFWCTIFMLFDNKNSRS